MATVWNQPISIRLRGSAIEERKSAAKNSGKTPCTASPEPVRSPISADVLSPGFTDYDDTILYADQPHAGIWGLPEWVTGEARSGQDSAAP